MCVFILPINKCVKFKKKKALVYSEQLLFFINLIINIKAYFFQAFTKRN